MVIIAAEYLHERPVNEQKDWILCTVHIGGCEDYEGDHYRYAPGIPEWARPKPQPDTPEAC